MSLAKRIALSTLTLLTLATSLRAADPLALTIHTDKPTKQIDVRIYGQFLEHIFNSVHGGLWGDQILNGTLELKPPAANAPATAPANTPPRNWQFLGSPGEVQNDATNPLNADNSIRIQARVGDNAPNAPGILQNNIALKQDEKYTLTLYLRGAKGSATVSFYDRENRLFSQKLGNVNDDWQKFSVDFTVPRSINATTLMISTSPSAPVNIDQISLFSASALATGGYRPDLLKAVSDLQPATIRWPGGSFANKYLWRNGIGPREKRLPHPVEQWSDRDPNQFGTDEFLQLCEKIHTEPILVLNTARGVDDALAWLEYCMGDATTENGKLRAANGHPAPYALHTIEIDNETWLLMKEPAYIDIVNKFCPAIRAKYPKLQLSVCGSYAYDTGPGEGDASNANWDPRLLDASAKNFDILSPHYYNGLLTQHPPDFKEDPRKYEAFLQTRGDLIKKSANPNIKIYVSEWNLTNSRWGNDWRVGLYAGGILNAFERQSDRVTMSCPALFMRKIGVTTSWDNALINFDQSSWFPAANYVVMKLWRESYAPNLLAVDGPDHPLNLTATQTQDGATIYLKMVNPETTPTDATFTLDGTFTPRTATMQLIAPGAETTKNSIAKPDAIKPVPAEATVTGKTIKATLPPLSAAVIKLAR